jgi:membrane-associated phospholipid phosphatase
VTRRILVLLLSAALVLPACRLQAEEQPGEDPATVRPRVPSLAELPKNMVRYFRETVQVPRHMTRAEWMRFGAGAAAIGLLAVYDEPIRDNWKKRHDDFYDDFKPLGEYTHAVGFFLASYLAGWVARHPGLAETGCAGLESLLLTGVPVLLIQNITGRERPDDGGSYHWFSFHDGHGASGHAATAFCTVTVLDRRYLGIEDGMTGPQRFLRYTGKFLLYGAAVCTALERINDDKHYASDVALGGTIAFLAANFVMNRRQQASPIRVATDGETAMVYFVKEF